MIGSIYRTDAEPDAFLWWSDRAQETAAKAAGGYGRKHRQQKTKRHRLFRVKHLQEKRDSLEYFEKIGTAREL